MRRAFERRDLLEHFLQRSHVLPIVQSHGRRRRSDDQQDVSEEGGGEVRRAALNSDTTSAVSVERDKVF